MDNHDYSITDQVLLARISEGDALAFERLFEKYHKKLGNYLLHFTSSAEEAKELIQEVFLRIWEKRDSIATVKENQQKKLILVYMECAIGRSTIPILH